MKDRQGNTLYTYQDILNLEYSNKKKEILEKREKSLKFLNKFIIYCVGTLIIYSGITGILYIGQNFKEIQNSPFGFGLFFSIVLSLYVGIILIYTGGNYDN